MVPPFEVSVFAYPGGAFTAAALVACVERELRTRQGTAGLDFRDAFQRARELV